MFSAQHCCDTLCDDGVGEETTVVETYTLVEVVTGAQHTLAAAQKAAYLVGQLCALRLLQPACVPNHEYGKCELY